MKKVRKTQDLLVIRSLPLAQVLLGLIFLGSFVALAYGMGQSATIACSYPKAEGVTCGITYRILGIYKTKEITVQGVQTAQVEESISNKGNPQGLYRVVLVTTGEKVPLSSGFTSGRSSKDSFVERFNRLLEENRGKGFSIDWKFPWWFFLVAGPFGLVGLLITFSARVISISVDLSRSLLTASGRGLFGQATVVFPLSEIREFQLKTMSIGRGSNLYALGIKLENNREITLGHYALGERKNTKIIEEIRDFVKGEHLLSKNQPEG